MDREVTAAPPAFGELRRLGWRRLFGYLRPYHWQMAAAIVGLLVASAIGLAFRRRRRGVGPAARAPEHAGAGRPGPVHRGRGGGAVGHQGSAELRPRGLRGRALHRFGIGQLASLYGEARQALGAVRRVFELLDAQSTVRDQPGAPALPRVTGEIHFDHVSFGYGPGATVLRDIDLTVAPGEIVALVGPSGAGKSTLFNLIPRFYDPTAGAVRIDGRDLRAVTAASVREQVGLVPQEALLFGGTVRENIRYGRLAATDAEIEVAARAANAHDFIAALPQGYDTVVGERGTRLSGGQRQRIAIARAILKDPRILLLDEATSALDTESERLVQAALERLMQGRTCSNDILAFGAIRAALDLGLRVPHDLSVVGFDDSPMAVITNPRLTTMAQPALTMGVRACELLCALIEGETPETSITLPTELQIRETTAPPPER